MAVSLKDLRAHLAGLIDQDDLMQKELAERFIMLTGSLRRFDRQIRKDGESVEIINGGQRYIKAHPLIDKRARLNRELLLIEKQLAAQTSAEKRRRAKQKERQEKQEYHREQQERIKEARLDEREKAAKRIAALEARLAPEPRKAEKPEARSSLI